MHILKQGTDALVPVVLNDASTGNAYNGALYNNVQATVIKNDGTVVDLGALVPEDWTQIADGAYSQKGYYLLKLPASVLDQEGMLHYGVALTGVEFYPGVATVRARSEKEVFDRIGAPVGASISADIQNISAAVGGEGGFQAADRQMLIDVKAKTDLVGTATVASKADVDNAAATTFTASDRSNLGAIKAKTDNLPASPAAVSDVTGARDNVNTNTNTRATELKGSSWSSVNDTMHQLRLQIDAVKAKSDLIPADPATETSLTAIKGASFDTVTDSLHQLQLNLTGIVSGSGGFTADDRAALTNINGRMPGSTVAAAADVTAAADTIMGVDTTNSPYTTKRTVSEVYVYARNSIHAKTTNLPSDPASNTVVNTRATEIKGSGFTTGDDLHTIKGALNAANFTQSDRDVMNGINTDVDSMRVVVDNIRNDTVAIKGKTDNLPVDPASNTHIDEAVGAGSNAFTVEDHDMLVEILADTSRLPADPASQTAGFGTSDRDVISAIRSKTDLLPPDPASTTSVTALSNKVGTPAAGSNVVAMVAETQDLVVSS